MFGLKTALLRWWFKLLLLVSAVHYITKVTENIFKMPSTISILPQCTSHRLAFPSNLSSYCGANTLRIHSLPFISGDGLRCFSDFIYDETKDEVGEKSIFDLISKTNFTTPVVFVQTDMLDDFFIFFHYKISQPYILVSHNSDAGAPMASHISYLEESKIIHWFAQNALVIHTKVTAIPIGIENNHWQGFTNERLRKMREKNVDKINSTIALINFSPRNTERLKVVELFQNLNWTHTIPAVRRSDEKLLHEISSYKYAFSPRGNGLDCHRTYEMIILGVIPIVSSSTLDSIFQECKEVFITHDWENVSENILKKYWQENEIKVSSNLSSIVTLKHWTEKIYLKGLKYERENIADCI
jgi:hypothetical protein